MCCCCFTAKYSKLTLLLSGQSGTSLETSQEHNLVPEPDTLAENGEAIAMDNPGERKDYSSSNVYGAKQLGIDQL